MDIGQTDLLRGVSVADAARIAALGSRRHLPAGELLFDLGSEAGDVFLVERGNVALTLPLRVGDGDKDVLVEERNAGQMVGWSGLIPPHRFTLKATAQAETDLLVLPRPAIEAFFTANPAIGYLVTRNLASIIGQRLQVLQAMWLREMQRFVEARTS
ncbi:MAG: Crp/Fnr family transcriptional regulator [Acidobacteriota bacterium]